MSMTDWRGLKMLWRERYTTLRCWKCGWLFTCPVDQADDRSLCFACESKT